MTTQIVVRELSEKPGKYIVVEESGDVILRNLSGIQGQSLDRATEIADSLILERLGEERLKARNIEDTKNLRPKVKEISITHPVPGYTAYWKGKQRISILSTQDKDKVMKYLEGINHQ